MAGILCVGANKVAGAPYGVDLIAGADCRGHRSLSSHCSAAWLARDHRSGCSTVDNAASWRAGPLTVRFGRGVKARDGADYRRNPLIEACIRAFGQIDALHNNVG